jgi:hypothetical protein
MRVVQVVAHPVILVTFMGDGRMATIFAVVVAVVVTRTLVVGGALGGVLVVLFHGVVVHMVAVWMMQVPVMQVIHVTRVFYFGMGTIRSMLVSVFGMGCAIGH